MLTILALLSILVVLCTLLYLQPRSHPPIHPRTRPAHILIVLGSGGHTAEMLHLLHALNPRRYTHRTYIVSSGDAFSASKAREFESKLAAAAPANPLSREPNSKTNTTHPSHTVTTPNTKTTNAGAGRVDGRDEATGTWSLHTLPRARRIHQSLLTTPFTCLSCLAAALRLLCSHEKGLPDIIVTNGPATACVVLIAARMARSLGSLISAWRACRDWAKVKREAVNHKGGSISERGGLMTGLQGGSWRGRGRGREVLVGEGGGKGALRTIYVESWARVRTPSLSLKLIVYLRLCDRVIVQHRALAERGWGEWKGDMMI